MGRPEVTLIAQKLLLDLIVAQLGGDNDVSLRLYGIRGFDHRIRNWRSRGKVPLSEVVTVGRALGISPYALNYNAYCNQQGKFMEWSTVVNDTPIKESDKKFLINMEKNKCQKIIQDLVK